MIASRHQHTSTFGESSRYQASSLDQTSHRILDLALDDAPHNFRKKAPSSTDDMDDMDDNSSSSTTTTACLQEEDGFHPTDNEDTNCTSLTLKTTDDVDDDTTADGTTAGHADTRTVEHTDKNTAGNKFTTRIGAPDKIFGCMTIRTQEESMNPEKHSHGMHLARLRRQLRFGATRGVSFSSVTSPSVDTCSVTHVNPCEHQDHVGSTAPSIKTRSQRKVGFGYPSSSRSNTSTRTPIVRFDAIHIQSYPIILGCNPSVSKGAPISIGWEPFAKCEMALDKFELSRPPRRWKPQLKIPYDIRYDILERAGVMDDDVEDRVKEVEAIKKQRLDTERSLWKRPHQEYMERFVRAWKNMTSPKKKHEEREFIIMSRVFDETYQQEANRLAEMFGMQTRRSSLELYGMIDAGKVYNPPKPAHSSTTCQ